MRKLWLLLIPVLAAGILAIPIASAHTKKRTVVGVRTRAVGKPGLRVGTLLTAPAKGPKGQKILKYQWELCNVKGAKCSKIKGATKRRYRVVTADLRHTLRVAMLVPAGGGQVTVTSGPTLVVVLPLPVNTVLPVITGCGGTAGASCVTNTPTVGETLSTSNGTWTNALSFTYQWNDCNASGASCVPISGATAATYTIQDSDAGDTLDVTVTAYNYVGG